MSVDILIDKLTDCLIERSTGERIDTEYRMRIMPIQPKDYKGWKFDWSKTEKAGYDIYELFLAGDDTVQGRISLRIDGYVAFTAKSDLIAYYRKVLHAQVARGQRMFLDEAAAEILLDKYIRK